MKYSIILSISKTHLLSRKRQSIVAALGVTFGIGAYIILMSFMTGLNGLLDGLILNRTPHVHMFNEQEPSALQPIDRDPEYKGTFRVVRSVKPKTEIPRIHNAIPLMELFEKDPRVKGVTRQVRAQGFYIAGSTQLTASLLGVDVVKEAKQYNLNDYLVNGKARELAENENGILLGKGAADKMAAKIGDIIQVGTVKGDIFHLKVVGFYQSGLADVDNVQSYVNLKTAQRIVGESHDYITDINLKLYDMEDAPAMSKEIQIHYDVNATDIQTANAQFETGTTVRTMISYAVSITLLIVAGFGIYNILNMLIYEKMNDIAILKATGFSGKDVRNIFMSQALIIGFAGGVIGLLVGLGVSILISKTPFETQALPTIKTYPVNFNPAYYLVGIIFALISTFFAGFFPSRRAKNIDPVDIIRGQ
jgi:lipoprotein-releasing system permease protein